MPRHCITEQWRCVTPVARRAYHSNFGNHYLTTSLHNENGIFSFRNLSLKEAHLHFCGLGYNEKLGGTERINESHLHNNEDYEISSSYNERRKSEKMIFREFFKTRRRDRNECRVVRLPESSNQLLERVVY